MCHGHLDPKFSHRDIEARLAGGVPVSVPLMRLGRAVLGLLRRAAASPLSPLRERSGEARVAGVGAPPAASASGLPKERPA